MVTVRTAPLAGRRASAAVMSEEIKSAARERQGSHRRIVSLGTGLAQFRLYLLRHVEVRHKRRPHLDQQRLQLVDHYDAQFGLHLTEQDKTDLVEYLKSL
jgi:cyanophycinase-like exopeptidase